MEINEPHAIHFCHLTIVQLHKFLLFSKTKGRKLLSHRKHKKPHFPFASLPARAFAEQRNIIIGSLVPPRRELKASRMRIINCKSHSTPSLLSALPTDSRVIRKYGNCCCKMQIAVARRKKKSSSLEEFSHGIFSLNPLPSTSIESRPDRE